MSREHPDQPGQHRPETLTSLAVPVPPMLEQAIGYTRSARYVGFHWTTYGDEAYYDDGQYSGTGEWDGYLTFVQHPVIAPALAPYHPGIRATEGQHTFVLDRETRELFVASLQDASQFLRGQHPQLAEAVTPGTTQAEAMQAVLDALNMENWTEVTNTMNTDEAARQMQEHYHLIQAMQAWLDMH